jgi:hypothetical protein
MDDEVVIIGDDGTEHVFPAGFDPQRAAAIVRGSAPMELQKATLTSGAGVGTAKLIPGVLSRVVHPAAKAVASANPVVTSLIGSVAGPKGAAMGAGMPKVAGLVQRATAPLDLFVRGGKVMGTPAGPALQGARALSRVASKAALPLTLASGVYDTFNAIQESSKKLDDPNLDPRERQAILLALSGGFAQ